MAEYATIRAEGSVRVRPQLPDVSWCYDTSTTVSVGCTRCWHEFTSPVKQAVTQVKCEVIRPGFCVDLVIFLSEYKGFENVDPLSPGHCWVNTVKRFLFPVKGEQKVHPLILLHCYTWRTCHIMCGCMLVERANAYIKPFFFLTIPQLLDRFLSACLLVPKSSLHSSSWRD